MKIDFTQENGQNRFVSLLWSEYVVRLYHEYFLCLLFQLICEWCGVMGWYKCICTENE